MSNSNNHIFGNYSTDIIRQVEQSVATSTTFPPYQSVYDAAIQTLIPEALLSKPIHKSIAAYNVDVRPLLLLPQTVIAIKDMMTSNAVIPKLVNFFSNFIDGTPQACIAALKEQSNVSYTLKAIMAHLSNIDVPHYHFFLSNTAYRDLFNMIRNNHAISTAIESSFNLNANAISIIASHPPSTTLANFVIEPADMKQFTLPVNEKTVSYRYSSSYIIPPTAIVYHKAKHYINLHDVGVLIPTLLDILNDDDIPFVVTVNYTILAHQFLPMHIHFPIPEELAITPTLPLYSHQFITFIFTAYVIKTQNNQSFNFATFDKSDQKNVSKILTILSEVYGQALVILSNVDGAGVPDSKHLFSVLYDGVKDSEVEDIIDGESDSAQETNVNSGSIDGEDLKPSDYKPQKQRGPAIDLADVNQFKPLDTKPTLPVLQSLEKLDIQFTTNDKTLSYVPLNGNPTIPINADSNGQASKSNLEFVVPAKLSNLINSNLIGSNTLLPPRTSDIDNPKSLSKDNNQLDIDLPFHGNSDDESDSNKPGSNKDDDDQDSTDWFDLSNDDKEVTDAKVESLISYFKQPPSNIQNGSYVIISNPSAPKITTTDTTAQNAPINSTTNSNQQVVSTNVSQQQVSTSSDPPNPNEPPRPPSVFTDVSSLPDSLYNVHGMGKYSMMQMAFRRLNDTLDPRYYDRKYALAAPAPYVPHDFKTVNDKFTINIDIDKYYKNSPYGPISMREPIDIEAPLTQAPDFDPVKNSFFNLPQPHVHVRTFDDAFRTFENRTYMIEYMNDPVKPILQLLSNLSYVNESWSNGLPDVAYGIQRVQDSLAGYLAMRHISGYPESDPSLPIASMFDVLQSKYRLSHRDFKAVYYSPKSEFSIYPTAVHNISRDIFNALCHDATNINHNIDNIPKLIDALLPKFLNAYISSKRAPFNNKRRLGTTIFPFVTNCAVPLMTIRDHVELFFMLIAI